MIGLAACTQSPDTSDEVQESSVPTSSTSSEPEPSDESATGEASTGDSAAEASTEPDHGQPDVDNQPTPSEATQTLTFFIAGNNAQGTEVSIKVPEDWSADGDRLVVDGRDVARFEIAMKFDGDADVFLEGMDEDNVDAVATGELGIPGLKGKYYHFQTENTDGAKESELRYYVCIGDNAASILFTPAAGVGIETQREEFETYLATLEMK